MKNLLLVSIAFPPKNDPEGIQVAKYLKYLLLSKTWKIDVVTSANPTLNMPVDKGLQGFSNGVNQIIEIKLFENRYINFLIRKILPSVLEKPDSKMSFQWQWRNIVKKLENTPDIIYSRSNPISSAALGFHLKNYYKVPWILHLSDPWVDNPLHRFTKKGKKYNELLEKKCFEVADAISLTSSKTLQFYQKKYPGIKDKFFLSANVFDEANLNKKAHVFGEKLKFVYTGGLAGSRSPALLIKTLRKINNQNPNLLTNVEFIFAGQFDRQNKLIFEKTDLNCVKYLGLISYKNAIKLQREADILIVIDSPISNPHEAMFFPSKILDYMMARRKILAITSYNSSSYSIIDQENLGKCFDHKDNNGLEKYILTVIENWRQKDGAFFNLVGDFESYSAAKNVKILMEKMRSL